jgi:hypothetical protein
MLLGPSFFFWGGGGGGRLEEHLRENNPVGDGVACSVQVL